MSLDKDIIPSRNSMGDHGSKIGGGVVYREAKIVEFGFASTFTARIKTNRNVSKLNDDANNAIMARLTSATGSIKMVFALFCKILKLALCTICSLMIYRIQWWYMSLWLKAKF